MHISLKEISQSEFEAQAVFQRSIDSVFTEKNICLSRSDRAWKGAENYLKQPLKYAA